MALGYDSSSSMLCTCVVCSACMQALSNLQSAKLSSLQKLNDKLRTRFFEKNGMTQVPLWAGAGRHRLPLLAPWVDVDAVHTVERVPIV